MPEFHIGIYGKLPSHSDFITDQVAVDVSNELYDWAQSVIFYSREKMADNQWLSAYLVSPIWRMFVPSKATREHAWLGVMVPSVDAVGRYFPLFMVLEMRDVKASAAWLFKESTPLFQLMERTAMKALQERLTLTQLRGMVDSKLEALALANTLQRPNGLAPDTLQFSCEQPDFETFLTAPLGQLEGTYWWTDSDLKEHQKPFFKSQDLPTPQEYAFLLTGTSDSIQPTQNELQN